MYNHQLCVEIYSACAASLYGSQKKNKKTNVSRIFKIITEPIGCRRLGSLCLMGASSSSECDRSGSARNRTLHYG